MVIPGGNCFNRRPAYSESSCFHLPNLKRSHKATRREDMDASVPATIRSSTSIRTRDSSAPVEARFKYRQGSKSDFTNPRVPRNSVK
eukprot:3180933-Pyramimonas_sp.AAC.1